MGVPKRKTSKSRIRSRQRVKKAVLPLVKACPQCGANQESHRVCPSCGFYRGRQVMTVKSE